MRKILNCPRRSRINQPAGFTFVEFLVAACVLSVVAVSLGSVLRSGLRIWKHSENEMKLNQEARATLDAIGREFRRAIDVPGVSWSAGDKEATFAVLQDNDQIAKVSYRMMGMVLSRGEEKLSPDRPGKESVTALTSYPAGIEWEYAYVSDASGSPVRWEKDWTAHDSLPGGIRVRLTLYDSDARPQTFTRTLFSPTRDLTPWNN
jgi:type II secretory pathway pseudopilin PulG